MYGGFCLISVHPRPEEPGYADMPPNLQHPLPRQTYIQRVWARASAEAHAQKRLLGGLTIGGGRVRAHVGLRDRYPGTIRRKNRGNERGKSRRGGGSARFPSVYVSRCPPHALEGTGDLYKEESRAGRSGNDLGPGFTGCGGWIDERPREEGFFY
jgi:hypothetical protein